MKKKVLEYAMSTKLFWQLWLWHGIREARKRRIANEKWLAAQPKLTLEEYWEQKKIKIMPISG